MVREEIHPNLYRWYVSNIKKSIVICIEPNITNDMYPYEQQKQTEYKEARGTEDMYSYAPIMTVYT